MALIRRRAWLRFRPQTWSEMIAELGNRTGGRREAGAFLLADRAKPRHVTAVAYYDDLDPDSLDGAVSFHYDGYTELARVCEATDRIVVGDVHTHGGDHVRQSGTDQDNPMMARAGHIAIIIPHLATRPVDSKMVGVHRYLGDPGWDSRFGAGARKALYIGRWA